MLSKIIFCFLVLVCFLSGKLVAQSPAIDHNWQIQTGTSGAVSDEFNGTSLNTSLWQAIDCPTGVGCCEWGGATAFSSGNAIENSGYLKLMVDTLPKNFCISGGVKTAGINSINTYSYGYFEISALLPGAYIGGVPNGSKFWPAFWTSYQKFCSSNCAPCDTIHDEIDILEPSGTQYFGTTNVCGINAATNPCVMNASDYKVAQGTYTSSTPLFSAFHKYACEWDSNKVVYFFDDVPFYQYTSSSWVPTHPMTVHIDQQIDQNGTDFPHGMPFPDSMTVNYFHYYKLTFHCGIDSTFRNNSDIKTFPYFVMRNIIIGNGTSSITIDSSHCAPPTAPYKSYVFRVSNGIKINTGQSVTVPAGTIVMFVPTTCN